jgi:hypothetical protein
MKLTKAEKKIANKARSEGRKAEQKKARGDAMLSRAAIFGGAFVGQKFLGGMKGPGGIPVHYIAGVAAVALEMTGQLGKSKETRALLQIADGLVAGQLGVQGYMNKSNVLGG